MTASAALNFQVEYLLEVIYIHIKHTLVKYLRVRVRASAAGNFRMKPPSTCVHVSANVEGFQVCLLKDTFQGLRPLFQDTSTILVPLISRHTIYSWTHPKPPIQGHTQFVVNFDTIYTLHTRTDTDRQTDGQTTDR